MPIYLNREEEIKGKAPLEFYGDGQNLKDWEIQGKTSQNLFDTSVYNNTVGSIRCTVTSTLNSITIEATDRDPYIGAYLPEGTSISINFRSLYIPVKPNATYTINMSSAPKCYWCKVDEDNTSRGGGEIDVLPYSFTTDEFTKYITIRLGNGNLQAGDTFTFENIQLLEGLYTADTLPSYEPYGGVGDWDETEQKYRIPVKVDGKNLFDVDHFVDTAECHNTILTRIDNGIKIQTTSSNDPCVNATYWKIGQELSSNKRSAAISCKSNTDYTLYCAQSSSVAKFISYFDKDYKVVKTHTSFSTKFLNFKTPENCVYILLRIGNSSTLSEGMIVELTNIQLLEGTYTSSTVPPYEVDLYVDNQLLDGDSISLSSTQLNIPTLNNYNILTVPTQVQPSNITLTLPQTETEITKILGPLISPRYDITDAYFGNLQVFTVWDTYTGQLPTTLYTTDWGLVDYKIYGIADGAGIKTENLYNYNAPDAVSLNLYPNEENGRLLSGQNNVSIIFAVKPNTTYSIYKLSTTRFRWACYAAAPQAEDEATSFSSSVSNTNTTLTFTTDSQAAYAVVFIRASSDSIDCDVLLRSVVVVEGPYAAQDIPYGYKIPMRSQDSVVDIYIGDTPLGENEYVSYSDQKIYKYINGVLTPTDPPKELPTITTINGNTTIDTTLEEKQYITSDNKVYCVKNGGRYLLKGSGLRPDNFYSKYRKGGT